MKLCVFTVVVNADVRTSYTLRPQTQEDALAILQHCPTTNTTVYLIMNKQNRERLYILAYCA
jgi:hypothetical protein